MGLQMMCVVSYVVLVVLVVVVVVDDGKQIARFARNDASTEMVMMMGLLHTTSIDGFCVCVNTGTFRTPRVDRPEIMDTRRARHA